MGKTLERYLIREISGSFLAGLAVFTFVLLIGRILELVDLVLSRGVPGFQVVKLFAFIFPSFLEITIPMACLLAVVVTFGRLSSDGELTALRAAGISLAQMLRPVLIFAGMVAVLTVAIAVWVRPTSNRNAELTIYEIAKMRATAALRPRVFNNDFGGLVIYVDSLDETNNLMGNILLSDERDSYRRTTVFASGGRIVADEETRTVYLQLLDGTSLSYHAGQESYDKTDFGSLEVNLDLDAQVTGGRLATPKPREMSWTELAESRQARMSIGDPAVEVTIEMHRKFVIATAAIVMALLAIPLGMQRSRAVRARSMAVSIGVILLYYLLLSGAMALARGGNLPTGLAMWLPNMAMAIVALWMLLRAARDRWLYPSLFSRLRQR